MHTPPHKNTIYLNCINFSEGQKLTSKFVSDQSYLVTDQAD